MLEVLPIQDKEVQKKECEICGIPYSPDDMAYHALVEGVLVGLCQFNLTDEAGVIKQFAPAEGTNDEEALFVLGRGTLNFMDLCGTHKAVFTADNADEKMIRRIGFRKNNVGLWEMDLTDFFKHPCQHEEKE